MIVAIKDHQRKSVPFVQALRSQGWLVVPPGAPADILLIDHDVDKPGWRDIIDAYAEIDAKIVLYPHGANVMTSWDGPEEPYPVDACLVIGEGHKQVMETYGYPQPMHVIGWSFCEQRAFRPREIKRVLFAPTHPLGNGYLNDEQRDANARAYQQILEWELPLTVRHIGSLDVNGIRREKGVHYERAELKLDLGMMDDYDLVVSRETFFALSIARGIPTITYHQACPDNDPHGPDEPTVKVNTWESYRDVMRYPYDLESSACLSAASEQEASRYRHRFIGRQMDAEKLSGLLTEICETACVT